ncbi:septum formation family protein [Psychrobacter sp.]|uniref:septum formation family protein n=1 Tax=Psychrobacter sp. TaxID=56811 RepID=UPI0025D118FE|nr:septum formation family protein [Psychrobacter sp.]
MIESYIDTVKLSIKLVSPALMIAILATGCNKTVDSDNKVKPEPGEVFVGMCFNDASAEDTQMYGHRNAAITNIALQPLSCKAPHDNEVYYIHQLPEEAKDHLDEDEFFEDMLDVCEDEFKGYVGKNYKESYYEMSVLFPTTDSWNLGRKEAICYAFHPDIGVKLNIPLKDVKK